MHRSLAVGTHGMVASSHPLASEAGIHVMQQGGNAIDAAIATNAVLAVTQPHLCGIGGDLFYLIYEATTGIVHHYNGSGRSAYMATGDAVRAQGHATMPARGGIPVNVPGCIDAWEAALERFGTMPLPELMAAGIDYADDGFPISHGLVNALRNGQTTYADLPAWGRNFLPDGVVPSPGQRYRQQTLARTMRQIAHGGRETYYRGDVANRLVAGLRHQGSLLNTRDFADHTGDWVDPMSSTYRGHTVYETAPNSQGIATLLALNILDGIELGRMPWGGADYLHWMIEAKQLAFADRNRYLTDPAFSPFPQQLLDTSYADQRRQLIDPHKAGSPPAGKVGGGQGDTTYFAVADGRGNLVSCIQSNYMGFGSGVVVDGIAFQNRGAYFSLDANHVNRLEPHKRTAHTLMAAMVFKKTRPFLVLGSMGGDGQPQTHMQLISNILDFGMNVQEAIEAPRWMSGKASGAAGPELLHVEDRITEEARAGLAQRGHHLAIEPAWTALMGHAQAIQIGNDGELLGGADPRGDGAAIGF